jgi:hypothetical protein
MKIKNQDFININFNATSYYMKKKDIPTNKYIKKDGKNFLKIYMKELIKRYKNIYLICLMMKLVMKI